MSNDIFSVNKDDSIDLVLHIMKWKDIHHMPVITNNRELIGLITWKDVEMYLDGSNIKHNSVDKLMKTDIITVEEYTPLETAKQLMHMHNIGSLPVIKRGKLIGLVTKNDFNL
jgi:predicted transcriptional regulator